MVQTTLHFLNDKAPQPLICHIQPVTICAYCHKVKVTDNHWQWFDDAQIFTKNPQVSHGICPCCAKKHFPCLY